MSETNEVGGETYSLLLHALAESIQAFRVLEVGTGWGYSTAAFARSLSSRKGASIVTIDPAERLLAAKAKEIDASGVKVEFVKKPSNLAPVDGDFDILYIDGDPKSAQEDFSRFVGQVISGGLVIIDGYGGQPGPTEAVDNLTARHPFTTLPYNGVYSFAIHRKPLPAIPGGRYLANCQSCPVATSLTNWQAIDDWADEHIMATGHTLNVVAVPRRLKYWKGPR